MQSWDPLSFINQWPCRNCQVKRCIHKAKSSQTKVSEAISEFLLMYKSTPHITTGMRPAVLKLGGSIRSHLDVWNYQVIHTEWREILKKVKERIIQQQQVQVDNSGRRNIEQQIGKGERVYIFILRSQKLLEWNSHSRNSRPAFVSNQSERQSSQKTPRDKTTYKTGLR